MTQEVVEELQLNSPLLDGGLRAARAPKLRIDIRKKMYAPTSRVVIEDLKFDVEPGEFVSVLGPSGCGKTTLARMITGLDLSFDGLIEVDGMPIDDVTPERGLVFQDARLLPWMTVAQNIAFALPHGTTAHEVESRVSDALELVGLAGHENDWPRTLSGGMERRVSLARTLVNLPQILLLDEPTSALDLMTKQSLQDMLLRIHASSRLTTVLVTHDIDEAVYMSDRILVLTPGPARVKAQYLVQQAQERDRLSAAAAALRHKLAAAVHHD